MCYSTREAAQIMSDKGLQIEAATLRLYHKLGVFVGRKTSRGDLVYSTDDLVRLAPPTLYEPHKSVDLIEIEGTDSEGRG